MTELKSLSPITYYDPANSVLLNCYADTLVYRKCICRRDFTPGGGRVLHFRRPNLTLSAARFDIDRFVCL